MCTDAFFRTTSRARGGCHFYKKKILKNEGYTPEIINDVNCTNHIAIHITKKRYTLQKRGKKNDTRTVNDNIAVCVRSMYPEEESEALGKAGNLEADDRQTVGDQDVSEEIQDAGSREACGSHSRPRCADERGLHHRHDRVGVERLGGDNTFANGARLEMKPYQVAMASFSEHKSKLLAEIRQMTLSLGDTTEAYMLKQHFNKYFNKMNMDVVNLYGMCSGYYNDACNAKKANDELELPTRKAVVIAVFVLLICVWCALRTYYSSDIFFPLVEGLAFSAILVTGVVLS